LSTYLNKPAFKYNPKENVNETIKNFNKWVKQTFASNGRLLNSYAQVYFPTSKGKVLNKGYVTLHFGATKKSEEQNTKPKQDTQNTLLILSPNKIAKSLNLNGLVTPKMIIDVIKKMKL